VTANGSASQTTSQLTLTFSAAITGLTASDITLSGVSGVTKGTLSGSNPYTLGISGSSAGGTLNVSVSKSGYTISPASKSVTIYYNAGGGGSASIVEPDTFTVSKTSTAVVALLTYPLSQKSTVDTYTYTLYEDGDAVFAYTDAPSTQSDGWGTTGGVTTSGSTYGIFIADETLFNSSPGTYRIKVKITSANGTSVFTSEKTVTVQ
jgi:hypothetical protein